MRQLVLAVLLLMFLPLQSFANPVSPSITHVIYITLDGTRWQDIFKDRQYFKTFWQKYANRANLYGVPDSNTTMEVASIPISMPSYQSQMSGKVQACSNNNCGRIPVETLAEHVLTAMHWQRKDVATFANWTKIGLAVEHVPGATFTSSGNFPVLDPISHVADANMLELNQQQEKDRLPENNRYDKYTFAQALHYYKQYQPRFLWISFGDADETAHQGNLNAYHEALVFYDSAIDQLLTTMKALKLEKNTLVIITTDHGRGKNEFWTSHGPQYPESKRTWAIVINGKLEPMSKDAGVVHYNTLSIRPTIEKALGVI